MPAYIIENWVEYPIAAEQPAEVTEGDRRTDNNVCSVIPDKAMKLLGIQLGNYVKHTTKRLPGKR